MLCCLESIIRQLRTLVQELRGGEFGRNLFFSVIGIGAWSVVMFITNIFVGRAFGPVEYGRYALTLSAASIMFIPMMFGMNSSIIKYGAAMNGKDKITIISTALVSIAIFTTIVALILILFRSYLLQLFHLSSDIWGWAIVLAMGITAQYAADAVFRSYHAFKVQAYWLCLSAIVLSVVLWLMFFFTGKTFITYVMAIVAAYIALFLGGLKLFFAEYASSSLYSLNQFRGLSQYGFYALLGSIGGTLMMNVDRLMINYFIDERSVGLYMAYTLAATVILLKLTEMFINVFFPTISSFSYEQKTVVFNRLRRYAYFIFVPLVIITMVITAVTLYLFGKDYAIDLALLLLFSIQAALLAVSTVVVWLINSLDIGWIRHFTGFGFFLIILNILGNAILIPIFKLHGAVFTTIAVYFIYYLYAQYRLSCILPVYADTENR